MEDHGLNRQDIEIAYIRANQILSRWREEIEKAVSEGENYSTYSHMLLPSPRTDSEKVAMKLVHFKKIERSGLQTAVCGKTKEEKAAEITWHLVLSTKNTEPIAVTYLPSSSSESSSSDSLSGDDSTDCGASRASGTAIKIDTNKWRVTLDNNTEMITTDKDLLDSNKFYVERKWTSAGKDEMAKKPICKAEKGP